MHPLTSYLGFPPSRALSRLLEREFSLTDWGVEETQNGYVMEVEVPGLSKDDITLEVENDVNMVRVKGERKTRNRVSTVQRAVTFPLDADMNTIKASIENGLLTIECSRRTPATKQKRTVTIENGPSQRA